MVDFSDREKEIMANAWQCFNEEPKIDYPKLAKMSGFTNERSAANAWRAIKKKLTTIAGGDETGDAGGEGDVAATPKATPKRKKKATGDDGEETPAKKAKATPKKGKKAAAEKADDQDDEEEKAKVKAEASEGDDLV